MSDWRISKVLSPQDFMLGKPYDFQLIFSIDGEVFSQFITMSKAELIALYDGIGDAIHAASETDGLIASGVFGVKP